MEENRMDAQPVVPMPTGLSQQENIANEQESLSQEPGQAGGQIEDNILPVNASKSKNPCIYCAKNCTSGAIQYLHTMEPQGLHQTLKRGHKRTRNSGKRGRAGILGLQILPQL